MSRYYGLFADGCSQFRVLEDLRIGIGIATATET